MGRALGYDTVIVIPDTQSQEKKDMPSAWRARELVEVPAVPYKNPNNYVKYSGRLAAMLNECVVAERCDLGQSIRQHRQSASAYRRRPRPEIWRADRW